MNWDETKRGIVKAITHDKTSKVKLPREESNMTVDASVENVVMQEPSAYDLSDSFIDNLCPKNSAK